MSVPNPDAKRTCRCAKSGRFLSGSSSQLPTKTTELVASKPHPLCETPYASITLFRCAVCGQHWQTDGMQGRVRSGISWPQICIKIDDPADWRSRDDRTLRAEHFPEFDRGLDADRDCATNGCRDFPVKGMDYCNRCALKLRANGVVVVSR